MLLAADYDQIGKASFAEERAVARYDCAPGKIWFFDI